MVFLHYSLLFILYYLFFIIYSFFISNLVPLPLYVRLLNYITSLSGGKKYVCLHPEIF